MQQTTHVQIAQQDHTHTRTGLCACHVLKTHFPQTGARTSMHVHAMLGGRELAMTAKAARLANINRILGLLRALNVQKASTLQRKRRYATCVRQTHSLLRDVVQSRTVYATLVGREWMPSASAACPVNSNSITGLMRALVAQLAHIPTPQPSPV